MVGPDGNIWAITTSGVITEYAIPTAGTSPVNIVSGSDGNLYFVGLGNTIHGYIARITPGGSITPFVLPGTYSTVLVVLRPYGISRGPDGNIWYTGRDSNHVCRMSI